MMPIDVHLDDLTPSQKEEVTKLSREIQGLLARASDLLGTCDHVEWSNDCPDCAVAKSVRLDLARKQQQLTFVLQAAAGGWLIERLNAKPLPWWKRVFRR